MCSQILALARVPQTLAFPRRIGMRNATEVLRSTTLGEIIEECTILLHINIGQSDNDFTIANYIQRDLVIVTPLMAVRRDRFSCSSTSDSSVTVVAKNQRKHVG